MSKVAIVLWNETILSSLSNLGFNVIVLRNLFLAHLMLATKNRFIYKDEDSLRAHLNVTVELCCLMI